MDVRMDRQIDGRTGGCMDGRTDGWMGGWKNRQLKHVPYSLKSAPWALLKLKCNVLIFLFSICKKPRFHDKKFYDKKTISF